MHLSSVGEGEKRKQDTGLADQSSPRELKGHARRVSERGRCCVADEI